jgi:hypothetical protein
MNRPQNGIPKAEAGRRDRHCPTGFVHRFFTTENHDKGAAMKKVAIYAGLFALLASPFAVPAAETAQSSTPAENNGVSITGTVSCAKFGRGTVTPRKGMSVAQTIQYCVVFQHSDYILVAGKQIFRLSGDRNQLAKLSGETVTVAGHMLPTPTDVETYALMGTVAVSNIAPTKN